MHQYELLIQLSTKGSLRYSEASAMSFLVASLLAYGICWFKQVVILYQISGTFLIKIQISAILILNFLKHVSPFLAAGRFFFLVMCNQLPLTLLNLTNAYCSFTVQHKYYLRIVFFHALVLIIYWSSFSLHFAFKSCTALIILKRLFIRYLRFVC